MDLHVPVLPEGRERTAAEFAALFGAAGVREPRTVPADAGVRILVTAPLP